MKLLTRFLALFVIVVFILFFSSSLPSCTKTTTVHDTTTVIIKDTITNIVRDTVTIRDSVWNITNGLVAYYNFNGGNLNDSSGYSNNITYSNATPTTDRLGNPNNAYLFDGSTSYMEIPNSPSINPTNITLFAIVKINGFYTGECHGNAIINKGSTDAVQGYYSLRFNDSSIMRAVTCTPMPDTVNEFFYGQFGDDIPVGACAGAGWDSLKIQKGEWYALTFTYDGYFARCYLDGALVSSQPFHVPFNANTDDLFLGKTESSVFPYSFNGVIDEVRIYNRAITPTEVTELNLMKNKYVRFADKLVY